MPHIKHATKKRFAKTTTRKKTIVSGISAEYVDYTKRLDSVSTSIKALIKEIKASRDVWLVVAKHQRGFAEALVSALPKDGIVRTHAKEVEGTVRQLQRNIIEDEGAAAPHRRITAVLESYLKLIQNVEKDYAAVEMSFSEALRYQKKVDKLIKKGSKKEAVLNRNMEKLNDSRTAHQQKLEAVLKRMKNEYEKHEAVFQCAHHAFWIAHDKYSHIVNEATKNIRWESVAVREHLVNIDINNTPKLPPIPRVQMLPPPTYAQDVGTVPLIEEAPSVFSEDLQQIPQTRTSFIPPAIPLVPAPVQRPHSQPTQPASHSSIRIDPYRISLPATAPPASPPPPYTQPYAANGSQHVVHLTPEKPSVSVSLPPGQSAPAQSVPVGEYMPNAPVELPVLPESRARKTAVGV